METSQMRWFKVRCFDGGIWDEKEPRNVEAASALEAAELICGEKLIVNAKLGTLRAEVWEPSSPATKTIFRVPQI